MILYIRLYYRDGMHILEFFHPPLIPLFFSRFCIFDQLFSFGVVWPCHFFSKRLKRSLVLRVFCFSQTSLVFKITFTSVSKSLIISCKIVFFVELKSLVWDYFLRAYFLGLIGDVQD